MARLAPAPEAVGFCPFCEGQRGKTPPEVFALRAAGTAPDSPGWTVRVVPNKFPALNRGRPPPRATHGLFQSMEGRGVHEVVIENPDHGLELGDLPVAHIRDVLRVFQMRIRAIESELHYQYVQLFKNKGKEAGASLSHPHSQIVATPIVPKRVKEEIYGADRLFRNFKECVFCRILREEEAAGARRSSERALHGLRPIRLALPLRDDHLPERHSAFFTDVREDELLTLAETLKHVLTRLKETVGDPPYNMVLHQAPNPARALRGWPDIELSHWHLEIIPDPDQGRGFRVGDGFLHQSRPAGDRGPVPPPALVQAAAIFL